MLIAGAYIGGSLAPEDTFNGMFPIASVPSPTKFTYLMPSAPGANADASPAPKFGALWQVGRLVIEHNVVELVLTITTGIDLPTGIRFERQPGNPAAPVSPYAVKHALIRSNVIHHVNNASDSSGLPLAIQLTSCEGAIVEENVIDLDRDDSIQFASCGSTKFFNNQSPSGSLVQGYDGDQSQYVNELTTDTELGVLLAT